MKNKLLILYVSCLLGVATASSDKQTQYENEDTLTDPTISFGIRSFTVEVTTPTEKSKSSVLNESSSNKNRKNDEDVTSSVTDLTSALDAVEEHEHYILENTTDSNSERTTTIKIDSTSETLELNTSERNDRLSKTENEFKSHTEEKHEEEATDEKPPLLASSSISPTSTETPTEKIPDYIMSTQQVMINDIHVEKKLENGLYRIKLAEIITDEFHGISPEDGPSNLNDNLDNKNNNADHEHHQQSQSIGGKINIIDLYPSKLEDFSPIIKESNEKIIKDKQIYLNDDRNLFPNSLNQIFDDEDSDNTNSPASNIEIELIDDGPDVVDTNDEFNKKLINRNNDNIENQTRTVNNNKKTLSAHDEITDFTGKLQEQDGVITEIEKKFRLDELKHSTAVPITVNHKIEFIDRRVKKNDPFMSKFKFYNSDGTLGRIDFANTKFNTDSTSSTKGTDDKDKKMTSGNDKPEFSTTKFYNSKELYNEMIHKNYDTNTFQMINNKKGELGTGTPATTLHPGSETKSFPKYTFKPTAHEGSEQKSLGNDDKIPSNKNIQKDKIPTNSPITKPTSESGVPSTQPPKSVEVEQKTSTTQPPTTTTILNEEVKPDNLSKVKPSPVNVTAQRKKPKLKPRASSTTATSLEDKPTSVPNVTEAANTPKQSKQKLKQIGGVSMETLAKVKSTFQGLAKNAKTKAHTKLPSSSPTPQKLTTPTITTTTISSSPAATENSPTNSQGTSTEKFIPTSTIRPSTEPYPNPKIIDDLSQQQSSSTKPSSPQTPTIRKPFSRPRVLTRLQEKINSLECEIQNMPQDAHLWRGNETHELFLPITTPEDCNISDEDCSPTTVSWEGQVEIQSGDVLLVEINDAQLIPVDFNQTHDNNSHKATTAVYQVTRPGHEHCDVTEGVLLDITPLVVDGRKLVTLYDKDLTEGINLLIVVSELWRSQCIRLKVTVKSDNCGENAECSGKGVCFSNISMEGYECQCCSGFAGSHCEEIDACSPSPCTNNGICVDLSQGHEGNAYQCLCPYGYTGKNCQYESDPCNPTECMNGGSCVGNATHFRCDCAPGYTGPLCQHNLNECESTPCVHGICVDEEDGFRCFCQPGFSGELCNFEYNECESNPCLNGGQCIDQIGSFECKCTRGYTGNRCHIKVEFCANGPCPEGHRCIDRGDDFTCECPGGRNGPDCNQVPRTQCNVNPCANGGTCWTSEESFYCACRPGYTGKMCEDEFVVETVVSSSEFMTDDTSARGVFNDKGYSATVAKAPIELHNAYIAAGTLAAAIFIVAVVVTICHCKVHQTYRRFSTRQHQLIPIFGFGRRNKSPKSHRHWLSGKGGGGVGNPVGNGNIMGIKSSKNHLPGSVTAGPCHNHHIGGTGSTYHHHHPHQVHERPFQRHLAMNLENDMYYTVDFSDSQHSPLIQ